MAMKVRSPYRTRAQLVVILSMWVVIVRLYIRVTPRTEMASVDVVVLDSFEALYNVWW